MTRCPKDERLFLVVEGEGSEAERAHLAGCPRCTERAGAMRRASAVAADVLRTVRVGAAVPARRAPRVLVRPLLAAAAALVLVAGLRWWNAGRGPGQEQRVGDLAALSLDHVARALFADDPTTSGRDADATYLQAALRGEMPCESLDDTDSDASCVF